MRYHELTESRIDELFDTQGVTWESPVKATFKVNGQQYTAFFKQDAGGGSHYDFSFTSNTPDSEAEGGVKNSFDNTGVQGSGASKVFGYAIQCLAHFLKTNMPRGLSFSGFHNTGRDQLYNKMAVKLGQKFDGLGYALTMKRGSSMTSGPYTSFDLHRQFTPPAMHGPPKPEPKAPERPKTPEQVARDKARLDALMAEFDELFPDA